MTWLAMAALLSTSALAKPPRIESRVGTAAWRSDAAIYPLKGEAVRLRVRPGDLIAVRYAGPDALHLSLLSEGAFDGDVVILRP